jgi:hypothetical protein
VNAEVEALRRTIRRLADDAQWALKQEGSAVHSYCEGHAVCDLVNGALFAARHLDEAAS